MEKIFSQLQGILVQALPAFFLVLLLHFYLKKILFQPLERVLAERSSRTEGTLHDSEAAVQRAAERMQQYEASLADARATVYKEMEEYRSGLAATQSKALAAARDAASARVAAAKAEIAAETESARATLAGEVDRLADQIASTVLAGGRK